jgi:hypothetical protein
MTTYKNSLCWNCEKNCQKKEKRKRPGRYVAAGGVRQYIVEKCDDIKDLRGDGKK